MVVLRILTACFAFCPPVLWSTRPVRGHAEVPEHRLHSPLHLRVHPQDHRLRSAGEAWTLGLHLGFLGLTLVWKKIAQTIQRVCGADEDVEVDKMVNPPGHRGAV